MVSKYITEKQFEDFNTNFRTLIETFNHKITEMAECNRKTAESNVEMSKKFIGLSTDVKWLKKLSGMQTGLLVAIFLSLLGAVITFIITK